MFGQNNQSDKQNAQIPDQSIDGVISDSSPQPVVGGDAPASSAPAWQHPGAPLDAPAALPLPPVATPFDASPAPQPTSTAIVPPNPSYDASQTPTATTPAADDVNDLMNIKQQALSQLTPLVGQLDQTPEDKFRTTMMMIQASDDQSLVKTAYEAAGHIEDEKVRAQALLDIVNEINYFTQHHED